jgi:hypothetical protein
MIEPMGKPERESERAALKAKPPADVPKESLRAWTDQALKRASPEDAQALKQKGDRDALKDKRNRDETLEKARLATAEVVALKEKLAPTAAGQGAKPSTKPSRRRRQPRAKRESALRPVPDPALAAPTEVVETRVEPPQECEIRWWRGYVKSQFVAVAPRADGTEASMGSSPYFRWRGNEPPPETPGAAAALRALVSSLEHLGWTVAGRGEEWFAVRLRAPREADGYGTDVGP